MTRPHEEQPQLSRDDQQFIARCATHYGPTPMSLAQRMAFDEALWRRLQRPAPKRWLAPACATLGLLVVVWLTLTHWFPTRSPDGNMPGTIIEAMHRTAPWEYELLYSPRLAENAAPDDNPMLPDDYKAIAQVFLTEQ